MLRKRSELAWLATLAVLLGAVGPLSAQEVRLAAEPVYTIGTNGAVTLHRVRGAAFASDGALVINDSGNFRVLVVDPNGVVSTSIGREGAGPGEFQFLAEIDVFEGTLLTYDGLQSRLMTWSLVGELVSTDPVPPIDGAPSSPVGPLALNRIAVRSWASPSFAQSQQYTHHVQISELDLGSGGLNPLHRGPLSQSMFWSEGNGTTTYPLPFLGAVQFATWNGALIRSSLEGPDLYSLDGGDQWSRIPLPIPAKPFDERVIGHVRDSLMNVARSSPMVSARLERMFDAIEPPPLAPFVLRLVPGESHLWVQTSSATEEGGAEWLLVGQEGGVVATGTIPQGWVLLATSDSQVAVLRTSEFDEQRVEVYRFDVR